MVVALPSGVAGRLVQALGTWLRVAQWGRGRDLLLIHGSPGTIEDWHPIRDRLAASYRLTVLDRPGHGWSEGRRHVSVADNAAVAIALCDVLGLEEVTVVGHSYGGAVAVAMALERPRRVHAYVSVGGALLHGHGQTIDPSFRALALPVLGPGLARLAAPLLGRREVERGARRAFKPNLDAMPPGFLERARSIWAAPRVAVTTARERVGLGPEQERSLVARYPEISRRLVLVHGTEDRMVPVQQSIDVARMVPGAELHLLEGAGHYLQYARPDALAALIEAAAIPKSAVPQA